MRPATIELHIEELVLHNLAPRDRYRIADAVQRELTRLFAAQGAPPSLAHSFDSAQLDVGSFTVSPEARGEAIGVQVAQAVYGGLS